jgi:hypothetical protein
MTFISPTHSTIHEDSKTIQSQPMGVACNPNGNEYTFTYSSQDDEKHLVLNKSLMS